MKMALLALVLGLFTVSTTLRAEDPGASEVDAKSDSKKVKKTKKHKKHKKGEQAADGAAPSVPAGSPEAAPPPPAPEKAQ